MLYEPGETVELIADLMPATVDPYPPELPHTIESVGEVPLELSAPLPEFA